MNQNQIDYIVAIMEVQKSEEYISVELGLYDDWAVLDDVYKLRKARGEKVVPLTCEEQKELNSGYITRRQTGRWNHYRDIVRVTAKGKALVEKAKEAKQ